MAARLLLASRRGVADRRVSAPVESLRQDRLERSPRTDGGLAPWLRRLAERLVDRARSATARGCEHSSGKRIASLDYLTRRRESAPSGLPISPTWAHLGGDRQFRPWRHSLNAGDWRK